MADKMCLQGPGRGRKKTNYDALTDAEKPFSCERKFSLYHVNGGIGIIVSFCLRSEQVRLISVFMLPKWHVDGTTSFTALYVFDDHIILMMFKDAISNVHAWKWLRYHGYYVDVRAFQIWMRYM
jgi:hypothetical protein